MISAFYIAQPTFYYDCLNYVHCLFDWQLIDFGIIFSPVVDDDGILCCILLLVARLHCNTGNLYPSSTCMSRRRRESSELIRNRALYTIIFQPNIIAVKMRVVNGSKARNWWRHGGEDQLMISRFVPFFGIAGIGYLLIWSFGILIAISTHSRLLLL